MTTENTPPAALADIVFVEAPAPSPAEESVEAWFVEHFHNVPGLTTDLYNRFRAAADDLKARLRAKEP